MTPTSHSAEDREEGLLEPEHALPAVTMEELPAHLSRAASRAGWTQLMPVQAKAIPYLLSGRDLMVQSRTGSGKTGAFVLPILDRVDHDHAACQALILVPTRELAQQVARDAAVLGDETGLRVVGVYGGVGYGPQIDAFRRGAHLVVGTPGRILDHLLKRTLSLADLTILVFDEADRMMSMGFYPDMKRIQAFLPREGLNGYMFSATFPPHVLSLAGQFLRAPEFLSLSKDQVHVAETEHAFYRVPAMKKDRMLVRIIEIENPASALIFCNTKQRVHYVAVVLQRFGYDVAELSSDLPQHARDSVLQRVRDGQLRFLVATDVAARGIDILDLSHVLLERIADLVRDGKITGISDLRDESDRDGMRIVVDLKRDAIADIVLNQLYQHSQLQSTFGVNLLALVDGLPRLLTLRQLLDEYLRYRKEVVIRRTRFDLQKAEERAHILEGLKIALANIDEVVEVIKAAQDPAGAKTDLMQRFELSEVQSQAILDMRLARLTSLEAEKIELEYLELIQLIEELKGILASEAKIFGVIREEIIDIREKYGDERRTRIVDASADLELEDLIADEDMAVTISHQGYIKRLPIGAYRRQRRGGKGTIGLTSKEEDFAEHLFVASTKDYILFFTDRGRCYWLKVFEIPQAGRTAKGRSVANLLRIQGDEQIQAFVPARSFSESENLVLATRNGRVKKTVLSAYGRPRKAGIQAVTLREEDRLIGAAITTGEQDIILAKAGGRAIRFSETKVRPMGRTAGGVKGVRVQPGDAVVGMVIVDPRATLLTVSENGFGKRTSMDDYPVKGRAGLGVISMKTTARNGKTVAIVQVNDTDELLMLTQEGMSIRAPVSGISVIGRNTNGVRLIDLQEGDKVRDVARVVTEGAEGDELAENDDEDEIEEEDEKEDGSDEEN